MFEIIRKLFKLLNRRERRNAVIIFIMILFNGVMEAVGVASIMPFLSVLSNPEVIKEEIYLSFTYEYLNFSSINDFLIFLGTAVFFLVVFGLGLKSLTIYCIARFSHMQNYSLSTKLLRSYLSRPYSWFLNRNSADLGKTILLEVQQVIGLAIMPTAQCIAHSVIATCLIILLFLVDPCVAIFAVILLGGCYALLYSILRKYLSRIGAERLRSNQERFQISQEALGGIKQVKAAGVELGYVNSFAQPAYRFSKRKASNMIAEQVPRFAMQGIAFGGVLIILLYLLATRGGDLGNVLPTLGVFAFAGQRLMPALQQVYQNATKMRFGNPALEELYNDFVEIDQDSSYLGSRYGNQKINPMGLKKRIDFVNVAYWYPQSDKPALKDLNFSIRAKSTVGFVGPTGAGKTTAIDLILGLLCPHSGQIFVDGKPIFNKSFSTCSSGYKESYITDNTTLLSWQQSLGYVPQDIFLADDTIASNIAFGVPKKEIDQSAVEKAARIAELHDFVQSELSKGYETVVGERGVRLSGGQRQRVGIARALYHDPDVLIMDEATAALDNVTEQAVMKAVHNLSKEKTIIIIAHRLSTVQNCDQIYFLEHGRLVAQGTYHQLLDNSQKFRRMAAVNE